MKKIKIVVNETTHARQSKINGFSVCSSESGSNDSLYLRDADCLVIRFNLNVLSN